MPCYDGRDAEDAANNERELKKLRLNYAFLEAALCSTLKALELSHSARKIVIDGEALDLIDYKEAGILKEDLIKWKKEHDEKDRIRIENENG